MSRLLLSCLVLSLFQCLVFSCLLSLSLSVSLYLCLRVMLCVVLRGESLWSWRCWWSWCMFGVCVCVLFVCVCVCCGTLKNVEKNPVWIQKTPPCVHSKRLRVCRHHAHMCFNMCAWCRYTRDVLNVRNTQRTCCVGGRGEGRGERGRKREEKGERGVQVTHGTTNKRNTQGGIVSSAYQNLPT